MHLRTRSPSAGIALVEALVAIAVLSAALATSAVLLVRTVATERAAACRSLAVGLATSLADDLRSLARRDGGPLQAIAEPGVPPDCVNYAHDCALERAASRRLADWTQAALAAMPAASTAQVELLEATPPAYRIRLTWPAARGGDADGVELAVEP